MASIAEIVAAQREFAATSTQLGNVAIQVDTTVHKYYQGPIPPPEQMREYERVAPGAAQAILDMAQSESKHRHEMDKEMLRLAADNAKSEFELQRFSMGRGFWIAIGGLVVCAVAALTGAEVASAIIGSIDLVGLLVAYFHGASSKKRSERGDV